MKAILAPSGDHAGGGLGACDGARLRRALGLARDERKEGGGCSDHPCRARDHPPPRPRHALQPPEQLAQLLGRAEHDVGALAQAVWGLGRGDRHA